MNKRLKETLQYVLGIGLGAGLLYLAFRDLDYIRLRNSIRGFSYWWLGPAFLVGWLSHWFRAWRWKLLIKAAGYEASKKNAFWSVMVGYMTNNAVPRLGEITRCTMLYRASGVPMVSGVGTVVTERALDVLLLLVFMGLLFLLEVDKLTAYFDQAGTTGDTGDGGTVLLILAGVGVLVVGLAILFRRPLLRTKLGAKVWKLALGLIEAVLSIRKLRNWPLFILLSFAIWGMYTLYAYTMLMGMNNTPEAPLYFAFVATVMGAIGMAFPTPGGIGPYHNAIIITFLLFGLSREVGQTAAVILHTPQYIFAILWGAIGYFYLIFQQRKTQQRQVVQPLRQDDAPTEEANTPTSGTLTESDTNQQGQETTEATS